MAQATTNQARTGEQALEPTTRLVGRQARMLRRGDRVLVGESTLEVNRLVIGSEVTHVGFAGVARTFEIPSRAAVWTEGS